MKNNSLLREKNLSATLLLVILVATLLLLTYSQIQSIIEVRCLERMQEAVNTVLDEITAKLERDSHLLNAAATVITNTDDFTPEALIQSMSSIAPMLETMSVRVLLPDNTIVQAEGRVIDGTGSVSFAAEAPLGEHVSDRMHSAEEDNMLVLRHFIPIVKDGQTVALLYGLTNLDELPQVMSISNIYNGHAYAYIIDTSTGDYILDTRHANLDNIKNLKDQKARDGVSWSDCVKDILAGGSGYIVYFSETTQDWQHLTYTPANINRWTVGVSIPENEVFSSLYAIRRVCWLLGVLIALCLGAYVFWMHRNAKATVNQAVERAVLEEKLHKAEAAERAKTVFLSNMSHDIRTPMNAIIGFTTLAETNIDNKERVQEYLTKILSSSNHLLSLINDILDMSRIESGKLNIQEKECTISDIFRDMRNIIQTQMQSKQLNFFMDTMDVVDEHIYCDKLHLNQVLLNLLSNAIKFTPPGGSVSLMIKQKPSAPTGYGSYELRVKDTGIGMSEEFAQHIFEPFERERTSTVSGIQGTGLGMAITKSIIDTMGGTIELHTEKGKGTEFIINLDFRLQSDVPKPAEIDELKELRALVVDDNFSTCDSVTKMLMQIGMRPEWTLYGKEAVLRAKQAVEIGDPFYAYIIDWALPDLSGLEVVRQVRACVGDTVPIVILTAYDWAAFEEEARAAGVTAFCSKPLFLSELRDTLVASIGKGTSEETPIMPETAEELKGSRLLLVEDNELNREIAEELLSESGFVIETAEDGSIAVDMVKASQPGYYKLVLMDVQMPIMNGYEATRAIRALDDPKLSRIPIIAMTANAFDEDRREALENGMNAHVAKPIDVDKLIAAIHDVLMPGSAEEA